MKTSIRILSLAVLALTMAACSNDMEQPTAVQPAPGNAGEGIPFSATISTGSATTRALKEEKGTIISTWAKDEQVALIHNGVVDVMTAGDPDETTGNVTITGTLSVTPKNNDDVIVVYPASAVDKDKKAVKPSLLTTQDGTLTTIATSLNLRQSDGATFKVGELTATLNGTVTLANQIAIVKFSLSDGNNALAAKKFVIKDGSDNVLTTVTPSTPASDLYVAMAPATAATFRLEAIDGTFLYIYEKSGVTIEKGKYYQSPVTLDVVEETIDVSASGFSGTYDGQPHGISVTVASPTGAVVKYGTTEGKYDLDTSPEYTDAGNYTVYYQVTKDKYTTVTGSAEVKISKADMTVSATDYTGTYDEKAHGITVIAPTGATVKYGTSASSCTEASLTYTDADTYTVYYEVTKDNYNTVTGSAEVKIAKAAGSISYGDDKVEKKVSDSAFKNETLTMTSDATATVSYSSDNINVATVAADGTVTILSTGTATITATVTSSTNYSYSPDYAQYTLTVKSPNSVGESGGYTNAGDPISNN
ncbi:MAG: Ig-like domain-containing protein [Prevotella sp.]|nr:Ig-like domain-containing protein [Prevotella sp.]